MGRQPNPWDRYYHAHQETWRGQRSLEPLVPASLPQGARVLDLGCANGKLLAPLRRAGFDAVGLDISWNVLRGTSNCLVGDARQPPFRAGAFEAIFDVHCLQHVHQADRIRAYGQLLPLVSAEGWLIVEGFGPLDFRCAAHELAASSASEPPALVDRVTQDGRRTQYRSSSTLREEVEAAGWRCVHREEQVLELRGTQQGRRRHYVRLHAQRR